MKHRVIKTAAALGAGVRLATAGAGAAALAGSYAQRQLKKMSNKLKGEITMKKSTLIALVAFLSAVAGALLTAYLYLAKREKELDEYEQMLFSEECEVEDEGEEEDAPCAEEEEGCAGCSGCGEEDEEE